MKLRAQTVASTVAAAFVFVATAIDCVAADQVWPSFQNGGTLDVRDGELPLEWSPAENIAWKSQIEGYGQSSPLVDGDQVVVTSVSGPNKEQFHLSAYALNDGQLRWKQDFVNPSPKQNNSYTSRAAPTPVVDSGGYVAFFEGGLVTAVQRDGRVRWQRNLVEEYGPIEARHGIASSVEQNDHRVFVWVERSSDPYVIAMDKTTGETVWKVPGVGSTSWSSPRLIPTEHGPQLVCSASGMIVGYDPEFGTELWRFDGLANNSSNTPIPVSPGRFLIGASNGRGEQSSGGIASNGVIEITKQPDGKFAADFVWSSDKATTTFGSPVVAQGTACFVNQAGVLYRIDLETGELVSRDRTSAGGIWATPLVAGERLYLFGNNGTTSVISLGDGDELAENQTWVPEPPPKKVEQTSRGALPARGPVLYAGTPAPPYLLLRRGDQLYAVGPERP